MGGLVGLVGRSVGSDEFVLFNFPARANIEFDFVFVRPLGVTGEGGLAFPFVVLRGTADEVDCWSMMDAVGVFSVDAVAVDGSGSGRGGGGETLLRG